VYTNLSTKKCAPSRSRTLPSEAPQGPFWWFQFSRVGRLGREYKSSL